MGAYVIYDDFKFYSNCLCLSSLNITEYVYVFPVVIVVRKLCPFYLCHWHIFCLCTRVHLILQNFCAK